ncbi:hypothetical protein OH781_28950 [Streptomyces sp. NBC_01550]|uniref:hypothetical protein n=1 Tax=Streptomyces TaxID=1883 RepID=UPI00339B9487
MVRWARLPRDTSVEEEHILAETFAMEGALAALPRLAADLGTDPKVVDSLPHEYEAQHWRSYAPRAQARTNRTPLIANVAIGQNAIACRRASARTTRGAV